MPRTIDQDEFDDDDYGIEDEETDTIPCPYCGKEIYEDAEVCPHCSSYIIEEEHPSRPMWIVWTAILLLVLILCGYTCLL